ncbi:hypothetical protein COCOBI_08-2580 [Coccomyxa sp. Obi]|nr:hypothetical protein COCOBI_08-2580 [Coccomyxa sp. Obi]
MELDFRATQFIGSQADAEVLLEQPRAEIVAKQSMRRGRRHENEYYVRFPGYSDSESRWFTEQQMRRDPNGPQLIAQYEAEYEAAIRQEEAEDAAAANSSDEDMTSVDIQNNTVQQRSPVPPAVAIVHQLWTQQPSEPQLPQTQPPSQLAGGPALHVPPGPATQDPETTWEEEQRRHVEAAYRREVQAHHSRPAVQQPAQPRTGVLNGLPRSMWENSPLVTGRSPAQGSFPEGAAAAAAGHRDPVRPPGSHRSWQARPAGPFNAADAWGTNDMDEPSQEDLAAADWAAQHAVPRPIIAPPPARQSQPVGPDQIGSLAADPFRQQSPAGAAQPARPGPQHSAQPAAGRLAGVAAQQARQMPSSFHRNSNHWLGPSRGVQVLPLLAASTAGPAPRHDFTGASQPAEPAAWPRQPAVSRRSSPQSAAPPGYYPGHAAPEVPRMPGPAAPGVAPRMQSSAGAEPLPRQPLGPLPVEARHAHASRPLQPDQAAPSELPYLGSPAAQAAAGSPERPEPTHTSWFDSITMQLAPSRNQGVQAQARSPEQPPRPAATFAPPAPAQTTAAQSPDGLPPPRQWPNRWQPEPPQRLQSPVRPAQPAAAAAAPVSEGNHQVLMAALGQRAAQLIRQAPLTPEGAARSAAERPPQMEPVLHKTWDAWGARLRELGGAVAAAQVLPASLAARSAAPCAAALVDLTAAPVARAEPDVAEEPIEDVIDVPSLPADGGPQGSGKGPQARETHRRDSRRFKRLKRIYHPDTGEELPAPGLETQSQLIPDSSEDGPPFAGGRRSLPRRPTRFAHVIDDEEDGGDGEEVVDMESEQPHANSPVADSDEEEESFVDEYGLHAIDRQHLNEDEWEDAVISRARHEEEDVLLLRIHWPDGHCAWINRYALHVRPHCHLKLIDFYESKAKPKR